MATDNRRTHFYYMQAAKTRGEDAAKALKRAILAQAEVVSNRKLVLHTRACTAPAGRQESDSEHNASR